MGNRFAILDGAAGPDPLKTDGPLQTQRGGLLSTQRLRPRSTGRGSSSLTDRGRRARRHVTVPPSGHVTGMMARSDATIGVHKAPANQLVRGALGPRTTR